jgi:hypothetical protein
MSRTLVALLVTATAMVIAAPATAATPFTAGTGSGHDLAVGSDGTAHLAWVTNEVDDRVGYCRVPAGGTACDGESGFFNFPDVSATASAQGAVQVFAQEANNVRILATCTQCPSGDTSNNTFRWTSTDNGVTFPAVAEVGALAFSGQSGYIGGGQVLGVGGSLFQGLISPPPAAGPIDLGGAGYSFSASAVRAPALNEAVYAVSNLTAVKYRVYDTAAFTPASLNVLANWDADRFLSSAEPDNEETHLSAGGNGVRLSYVATFSPADARVGLRTYNPATDLFGSPTYLPRASGVDTNGLDFPHHSQDPGNRMHFAWRTLHDGGRLRYSRSTDGGASFSAPANLALGESFLDPLVEAGMAGTGFAAWRSTGGAVRIVAIDPEPEPEPAGPGTPGGPGGGGSAPGGGGTPGGSSGPGGSAGPDATSPTASGLGIGNSTLLPGQATTFSFDSSEAGQAVLTFQKRVKGLKVKVKGKRRCVPQTKRRLRKLRRSAGSASAYRRLLRKRRCKAWKRVGRIAQTVTPGLNTIAFNGRIAGRRLSPGLYRGRLAITDAAGNASRTETIRFRVKKKRRRR